jgi:predicted TIM-barrel fold metal-dependent hydrolase
VSSPCPRAIIGSTIRRAPHVPAHIKPLRVNGRPKSDFEVEPRLEAMAHDGFDIQVLIPNNSPFYYDVDAELGANVSRAYNQAISRVLKKHPNKFIGIAAAREKAKRRPKDCFNNFYFSFGSEDLTLPDVVKRIGSSRLMIGSDYPHPDGTSPNTISMLKARQGLTQQDIDNLLGGTAAEFFGLKQYL